MTQHLTLLSLTVGIEGVGPKKPRIQLKVAPSAEDKETTLPAQGSSNPVQGKNTEGQARQLVKGKRKLATEDVPLQEKRKKTAEDQPPKEQSSMDLSIQATVSTKISEGKTPLISKTEWVEATKPIRNLVRIPHTRTLVYSVYWLFLKYMITLWQMAQAVERATEKLEQKLKQAKSELQSTQVQAQRAAEDAQAKLSALEKEVRKLRRTSQGELAKAVVQKILGSKSFTGFVSQLCQLSSQKAQSDLLGGLAEDNGLPLRKKEYGWNPHANKVTRKTYAHLVLEAPPVFPILEHLSGLTEHASVEEIERWDKDNDLTLAEDLKLEVPEDYEDLDPSTPEAEIEKAGEDVPGVEKSADEAAMDEDNASPPEGEKGVEEPRPPNPVPVEAFLPEGTEAPVSQAGVNILEPLEKQI